MTSQKKIFAIVGMCVLMLHGAALWALHLGLGNRKPEIVVPVHLLAQLVEQPRLIVPTPQPPVAQQAIVPKPTPPKPRVVKPSTSPVATPAAQPKPKPETVQAAEPVLALATTSEPTTIPVTDPTTLATQTDKPLAPGPTTTAVTAAPAAPARPAPAAVELPSSDASYLQNPRPTYPPLSLRLREQGTVLVDVLVSDLGLASQAKVKTSSGFFRLDNAAVSTVLTWRFVPGKRAGVAQSMWFTVPIAFTIQ